MINEEISKIFKEMARLLEVKGDSAFRINAYKKSAKILDSLQADIADIYYGKEKVPRPASGQAGIPAAKSGLGRIQETGIGEKNAKKIEEYIKSAARSAGRENYPQSGNSRLRAGGGRIKAFDELQEETAVRQLVTHFFQSKGLGLQELKENARKRKIIYSRYTKPAKQLLELAGSVEKARDSIDKVASWANSRKLDYAIETVFKKWLELDRLKPKEIVKKPFYKGEPMVWSQAKRKWYVIDKHGQWLEFADKESMIEWKVID